MNKVTGNFPRWNFVVGSLQEFVKSEVPFKAFLFLSP